MKTLKIFVVVAVCLGLPSLAMADKGKLVGTWSAVSMTEKGKTVQVPKGMTITMTFKADGTWTGKVTDPNGKTETDQGTWTMAGDQLTTVDKSKKKETMTVAFKGDKMTFTSNGETLTCKRVK